MASIKPPFVIPNVEGWQGWTVLGLIGFMLVALVAEIAPPHFVMMGTLIILLSLSILDVNAAFHGFADEAMLSVAVLFVVAKGIEQSGGLEYVASILFKAPNKSKAVESRGTPNKSEGSIVWILLKFSVPVAMFSAFLANIPLVAMMIPPIVEFGNKVNMPPSKMLMPLSYAAQLGGTMTLIGAGTNLVVLSMAAQKLPDLHMSLFEIGVVGVPVTVAGILYIIAFSGKLLPERVANQQIILNVREYNVQLVIKKNSKLANKSIELSGLGRQPGLHLMAISRESQTINIPAPDFILQPNDSLHFVGVIDSVLLLVKLHGLILVEDEGQGEVDLNKLKATQILVEVVIAGGSSMVQNRIADLQCRTRFNACVVAIHRHGKRLSTSFGDIKVEPGDCLLMIVDGPEFVVKHRNNSHFALVSQLPGFKPINRKKALIASILVVAMVVASGIGMKLITAALFSSAGLLLTRCLTPQDAMESIELHVLIMIAAAFGIAEGMVESGAATILAKALMGLAGKSLFGLISCTYVATTLFSLAITNNAAVTIMFPVALAAANHQSLDFRPFAYTLMMAASAGFMTPTACPTNLMVYTSGSYKFSDYIYYGGPMQLWLLFITVGVTMTAKYWWAWLIAIFALTLGATPLIARHNSTHPKPKATSPLAVMPTTRIEDHRDDSKNYNISLNSTFILPPGHDDHESISHRTSQTSSTSPYVSSTHSSRFIRSTSPFPAPYSLEDTFVPTFASIQTSISSKDSYSRSHSKVLSKSYDPNHNLTTSTYDEMASLESPFSNVTMIIDETSQDLKPSIPKSNSVSQKMTQNSQIFIIPNSKTPFPTRQPLQETSFHNSSNFTNSQRFNNMQSMYNSSSLESSSSNSQFHTEIPNLTQQSDGTFHSISFTESDMIISDSKVNKVVNINNVPSNQITNRTSLSSGPVKWLTTRSNPPIARNVLPTKSFEQSKILSPLTRSSISQNSSSSGLSQNNLNKSASKFIEEDLTGGISNLLTSRRLSSLRDTSAFADNSSTHDH